MEEKLNAYPLKFEPNLKTVIWGGGKIRKLKKLADDVCPAVTDDGIQKAFLKYHLV